jgi:glycerol-3-phosphate acyltransferase PlsY
MDIDFFLLLIGGYLLGSVPAAYLATKWSQGIDIRQHGSGNIGATNLLRVTSLWIAIVVIIFDVAKGMAAVLAAKLIGLDIAQQVAVGLAAIIGHNWPVFLHFSGGRGLLATLGAAFSLPLINGLVPWEIIAFLALAGIFIFIIHNTPLGTGLGVAAMPLVSWIANEPLSLTLGFLAMLLLVIIRRLTAPKTALAASVSPRQLLLNRLLFDRDIRDREAWLRRQPTSKDKR